MTFDSTRLYAAKAVDLLALAQHYTTLKKVSACGGGEFAGPCPFCKGRDRFRVQLNHKGKGARYYCRQCGDGYWRDVIEFQKTLTGQSTAEAIRELAGGAYPPAPARPLAPADETEHSGPPNETWQARARVIMAEAEAALWSAIGARALMWLRARGLTDDTVRRARLGYMAEERYERAALWGMDGKDIYLPRGIVIPCEVGGAIWYLKTRRPTGAPKYLPPRGASLCALNGADTITDKTVVVFTEGEFDRLLLAQCAGDVAGVVTLGGALNPLDVGQWGLYLLHTTRRLLAHDDDKAGEKAAAALAWLGGARRILPPKLRPTDKDLTDYHVSGGDLRAWLIGCLESDSQNAPGRAQTGANDSTGHLIRPDEFESPSAALRAAMSHPAYIPGLPMAEQPAEVEETWWAAAFADRDIEDPAPMEGTHAK